MNSRDVGLDAPEKSLHAIEPEVKKSYRDFFGYQLIAQSI